jgi:phytoene desaturase
MSRKKIAVVGAGPGGLTAAMLLASHGYRVEVFEKQDRVGGRNAHFDLGSFRFDLGPTFLMMKWTLEEMFDLADRKLEDYLDVRSIDPFYRLKFGDDSEFFPSRDRRYMKEQMDRMFPGEYEHYLRYMEYEKKKFERLLPCLQVPYSQLSHFLKLRLLRAAPVVDAHLSIYKHLGRYFDDERLKLTFTFQAKYLGMSPWECPATFSIISYIEHSGGIHHPIGGLNQISKAMAKVVEEQGGRIHLSTPVKRLVIRNGNAVGIELESGDTVGADYVVLNADFGYAMNHLVPPGVLKKWSPAKLATKGLSCSTFMLYLGVDKVYDIPHHNIIFAPDYEKNVREITNGLTLSEDPSLYVQNACPLDPTLAPKGQSTIYVLVPTANNRSGILWDEEKARYREIVLDILETRAGLPDLRKHIVEEKIHTPTQWEVENNVYRGAVFNLAHTIRQSLYFRPHNQFEEIGNCYLAGGGTHPGSGLPTIYESGRISAGEIIKRDAWYLEK